MARKNGQAFNRLRQEREGDRAYHVNEVGFLLAEVCSLPAQLLHHPPTLQEGVRQSSRQPFLAQAVKKEGLPSAALALLQSVSSAPPPSSPSLSPLSTVHSVPVLECHPPTIDKNRRSRECVDASDTCELVVVPQPKRPQATFASKLSPSTISASLKLLCHP